MIKNGVVVTYSPISFLRERDSFVNGEPDTVLLFFLKKGKQKMKIITEGNEKTEYIFDCGICGCSFALTATEYASETWAAKCPCCGNIIGKHLAYKDLKSLYKKEENKNKKVKFGDITIREALNVCSNMESCRECPFIVDEDYCRIVKTFNLVEDRYLEDEIEIEEKENDQS